MGYMHINNLYRPEAQNILLFREVYAMEKIHGTSAHIRWTGEKLVLFSGGSSADTFNSLFGTCYTSKEDLIAKFTELFGTDPVTVYGEAYGGKCQGMAKTYGPSLRFVVFDVQVGATWLNVPNAEDVTTKLGLEFVAYALVPTDLPSLDAERDKPSTQAVRNGVEGEHIREGVVLRPLLEMTDNRGNRIIAKHKRVEFLETKTMREVDPNKLAVLTEARDVAMEWVTDMRLTHVLDKLGNPTEMKSTGDVVRAMLEDVLREGAGEFEDSPATRKEIATATAGMFKKRVTAVSIL